ncbi:Asp-tRNA(Asn)/Glu-tRNA(Gln) amidotransferase subunit GatC, partial [Candidatus Gottesmanbacteria bacterium]|nr:Asp-tRNA(Asn)/Glu-tRNA(Gln) amidotransferase subunit GatC [Candidatus Gottesmanbacteria bacterium]
TEEDVKKIATLASLSLTNEEITNYTKQLSSILEYVGKLQKVNTDKVPPTSQVTGLENVFREDIVDHERMLSQEDALSNAPETHNGYFVVKAIFEE